MHNSNWMVYVYSAAHWPRVYIFTASWPVPKNVGTSPGDVGMFYCYYVEQSASAKDAIIIGIL